MDMGEDKGAVKVGVWLEEGDGLSFGDSAVTDDTVLSFGDGEATSEAVGAGAEDETGAADVGSSEEGEPSADEGGAVSGEEPAGGENGAEETEQTESAVCSVDDTTSGRATERDDREKSAVMPVFFGVIKGALTAAGVMAYLILGAMFISGAMGGGFAEYTANSVFGGAEEAVIPVMPLEPEEELRQDIETDEASPNETDGVGIVSADMSCESPFTLLNETGYNIDSAAIGTGAAVTGENGGSVLIIHTHGTESYYSGTLSEDEDFRTEDMDGNVIAVGAEFARALNEAGVTVYHCTEMFDSESYIDSYARSGEAVMRYLSEHPDISYVIDIHRDAVVGENGEVVRSDGGNGAQIMIVCGSDEKGAVFPDWRENLAFAAQYQRMLFESEENLVRHINLRGASFNEQLCERYLLLEIGTCGNTLEEAKQCAVKAAAVFADLIKE